MAFVRANFATTSLGVGSAAPKVSSYITADDNKAAVIASGYFNSLADMVNPGDFIFVSATDGDLLASVNTNNGTTVTTLSIALA